MFLGHPPEHLSSCNLKSRCHDIMRYEKQGISSSVIVILKIFYLIHARNKYKSSDLYLWYMKLLRYYVYPPIYFSTRLLNDFTLPFSTFFRICYYPIYYPCCTLCLRDSEDNLNGDHAKLHLFWTVAWSVFITQ